MENTMTSVIPTVKNTVILEIKLVLNTNHRNRHVAECALICTDDKCVMHESAFEQCVKYGNMPNGEQMTEWLDKYNSQLVSIKINRKQYVPVGTFTQPAVRYEDENGCPWELHLLKIKNVTLP